MLLREGLAIQPKSGHLLTWLARNLLRQERYTEAAAAARAAIEAYDNDPTTRWMRCVPTSMLGRALLGQGEYAAAEPLLLQGYEGTKELEKKMVFWSWRVNEAVQHIIDFYEVTKQPEQADIWRGRLQPSTVPK